MENMSKTDLIVLEFLYTYLQYPKNNLENQQI